MARHLPALRAAAGAICRNADEAEDLVQDTCERALRYLAANNEPVRNLRAWLVTILRNVFTDRMRVRRDMVHEVEEVASEDPEPQPPWGNVTAADVRAACSAIDPHLRSIFELHYMDGLRYREIAARLSIPENTVASRLHRARKALRDKLLDSTTEEDAVEGHARTQR